jgi:hypothetical protein
VLHTEGDNENRKAALKQGWSKSDSSLPKELVKPTFGNEGELTKAELQGWWKFSIIFAMGHQK